MSLRTHTHMGLWAMLASLALLPALAAGQTLNPLDADAIGKAAGTKATLTKEGVVRLTWDRTDVPVKVDGMALRPAAGLTSWAALTPCTCGSMMMGDTVLFEDEITPAMDAAFAAGLQVTALHNHFLYDHPRVFYMHIGGDGDPLKNAAAVKQVWDAIKQVRAAHPTPAQAFDTRIPEPGHLDAQAIEKTIGHDGLVSDGVVKVTIGRDIKMNKLTMGGAMGLTTWAAFSGNDNLAAVDGDFMMTGPEVQPVLRALRKANINIVALHNHMIGDDPPIYFTHFWAKGPAEELASGIKATLDAQAAVAGPKTAAR